MGSMNWLGFSLSPQELQPSSSNPHQHHQDHQTRLGYNSDELSGNGVSGDCFDLTSDHSSAVAAAQLIPPTPFGILEAFNRNNHHHHHHHQSQDWNMKGLETNNYRTSSTPSDHIHLSMLMNNSTNNNNNTNNNQQQPKLENFLGRHSFSDHHHNSAAAEYMFPTTCSSNSLHIPSSADSSNTNTNNGNGNSNNNNNNNNNNGSSIGLSMIKTWLRNQPPNLPETAKNDGVGATTAISGGGANTTTTTTTQSALSLSMSSAGLQVETSSSSDVTKQQTPRTAVDSQQTSGSIEAVPRKSIDTFGQRTSIYRGVTRHRWTGRYEAHLWDNSCRREGQTRKGRQVYLGGYDKEDKAARAYDLAALKYWGTTTTTNFPISNYEKEVEEMKHMTRQEYVASLRRKSSGFSRGASIYRGVTRHHQHGRWQARIGRVAGNKDLYLGTFSTQEEAAEAYDIAAIKFRGLNAVTNFDMTRYDVKSILESATLPIGGAAKRLKDAEAAAAAADITVAAADDASIAEALGGAHYATAWPAAAFSAGVPPHFALHYPSNYACAPTAATRAGWCKQEVQDTSDLGHNNNNNNNSSFGYHDLHMNNNHNNVNVINTHNFFQSNSVLHNLMGIDNHHHQNHNSYSTSSTAGIDYVNLPMPTSTVISTPSDQQESSTTYGNHDNDHGTVFGASSADVAYHRSLYNSYMSQAQQQQLAAAAAGGGGGVVVKASGGGGGIYDSWVPTAVPTMAVPRSNTVALSCHGAPTFTVWNDA